MSLAKDQIHQESVSEAVCGFGLVENPFEETGNWFDEVWKWFDEDGNCCDEAGNCCDGNWYD